MRSFNPEFPGAPARQRGDVSVLVACDELLLEHLGADVFCLPPTMAATRARDLLLERSLFTAAVVDGDGVAVGQLSANDLLAAGDLAGKTVDDLMVAFIFALPAGASLGQAAALMAYEGVSACAVLDSRGRFAGLVTALDVARWMGRAAGYVGLLGGPCRTRERDERSDAVNDKEDPEEPLGESLHAGPSPRPAAMFRAR